MKENKNCHNDIITIVMPAYNAEKYIFESITSVIKQTYKNWELIIINDCSTDKTLDIVKKFIDARITIISTKEKSGSAFLPRKIGVINACGKWIINLDADDYLEQNYLEKMLQTALKNQLDIVTSQMNIYKNIGKNISVICTIPSENFNYKKIVNKDDGLMLTLPDWKLSMNGALIKKSIWEESLYIYDKNLYEIHDDETLSRILLVHAFNIGFCKVCYYYRKNENSITANLNKRTLDWRISNKDLLEFIINQYGENSMPYFAANLYNYNIYKNVVKNYLKCESNKTVDEIKYWYKKSNIWYQDIDWNYIDSSSKSLQEKIKAKIFKHYICSVIVILFLNLKLKLIPIMNTILFTYVKRKLFRNKYYLWYIKRKQREKERIKIIKKAYSNYNDSQNNGKKRELICIFDGTIIAGGLADRLKGILSTYYMAKKYSIPFKIYFKEPFPLEDFLQPALYPWLINKKDICFDIRNIDIIILDTTQDSVYQMRKQQTYLDKKISRCIRQTHVYTNAGYIYKLDYSQLFYELFQPSQRLQLEIKKHINNINSSYISVSCRFMDLLGDFNETFGYGKPLPLNEQKKLIKALITMINDLHRKHSFCKILINSDSITFLNEFKYVSYAYVIPGNITHIDNMQSDYCYEKYEKTFLDFMMIANAEKIYLLKSEKMFKSGYPFAASHIYNKPFELIEF